MSELDTMLGALGLDVTGAQVDLPTGGDFTPTGFIGPVMAGMLWSITSQDDHKKWNEIVQKEGKAEDEIHPTAREAMGNWGFRYYFREWEAANRAMEFIGSEVTRERDGKETTEKVAPQLVWRFQLKRDDIVNWASEEAKGKWRAFLNNDIPVKTLLSRKWRYVYHFLALSGAVASIGRYLGLTEYELDVSELASRNTVFDDRFYEVMCGHPDENKDSREEFYAYVQSLQETEGIDESIALRKAVESGIVKVPYKESVLWRRRVALWASLEEDDPMVYKPILRDEDGTPSEEQPKYTTTSANLDACLKIATATWTKPIWCRLMYVNDPKVDETFETDTGTKRRTIPIIADVFKGEAEARAAASEDGQGEGEVVSASGNGKPPLPTTYQASNIPEEVFLGMFKKYVGEMDDTALAKQMGITDAESAAWRAHLAA